MLDVSKPTFARILGSRLLRALLVGFFGGAFFLGGYLYWFWHRPLDPGNEPYVLRPGAGLAVLARELHQRGVISSARTFVWLGRLTGKSRQLKAGEYRFPPGSSASDIVAQVVAGRVIEYPLVLVEGWNFRQVLQALRAAPKLQQTLTGLTHEEIMARIGRPGVHPEGRFFPDTYYYSSGHTDAHILVRAFERMEAVLREEWERRSPDAPVRTPDEALVLASIIEKETGRPDERGVIAGVFANRLRRGMRLQSDPTVIYGLGEAFDGNIRRRDLLADTEYNTYTRSGLPPTPIAMPGRDSLIAALHPTPTTALYFVSRGDGSHVFSSTLAEHNAAVMQYQLRRRADPSGAPAAEAAAQGR
mgnify:CR=1 FL=1